MGANIFHRHVARLLSTSKRARPNIQVCATSLCTQVKSPTEVDYTKCRRCISYLKENGDLPLVVGADNSGTLIWNIDASFTVHSDYKIHT